MGQKVNANGLRIGITRGWNATWFASDKEFGPLLWEDIAIREYLEKNLKDAMLSHIEIGRVKSNEGFNVIVKLYVARPGVVKGQDDARISKIRKDLQFIIESGKLENVEIIAVENPDLDARLVARWICDELENRQSFRSTQKKAIQRMRKAGAIGCRTQCKGRLGGAEIARTEGYKEGVVPLETLRADIDYAHEEAATAYGRIGTKVWVCRSANKELADEQAKKKGGRKNASTKAR